MTLMKTLFSGWVLTMATALSSAGELQLDDTVARLDKLQHAGAELENLDAMASFRRRLSSETPGNSNVSHAANCTQFQSMQLMADLMLTTTCDEIAELSAPVCGSALDWDELANICKMFPSHQAFFEAIGEAAMNASSDSPPCTQTDAQEFVDFVNGVYTCTDYFKKLRTTPTPDCDTGVHFPIPCTDAKFKVAKQQLIDYAKQQLIDPPAYNYNKEENLFCGNCNEVEPTFGPGGERWQAATRSDVTDCKVTCDAHGECLGFNFVESHGKCYFRTKSMECGNKADGDRDCYSKEIPAPTLSPTPSPSANPTLTPTSSPTESSSDDECKDVNKYCTIYAFYGLCWYESIQSICVKSCGLCPAVRRLL